MMSWQAEYPTVAMVSSASFGTLKSWNDSLPQAQTDVERAVRRRIKKALFERAGEEVRAKSPEIADKWNSIMDKINTITGGKSTMRM